MIAHVQGRVLEWNEESVVVETGGVGYELFCSSNTLAVAQNSEKMSLRVFTHVREDAIQLFGFATALEKELFQSLIKVNGVGPKMAISILSATMVARLYEMIEEGDVQSLCKLPKVGKKKAEQIILTLKGKLVLFDDVESSGQKQNFKTRGEIISALVNLGFKLADVEQAVDRLNPEVELQEGVRKGLALLTASF